MDGGKKNLRFRPVEGRFNYEEYHLKVRAKKGEGVNQKVHPEFAKGLTTTGRGGLEYLILRKAFGGKERKKKKLKSKEKRMGGGNSTKVLSETGALKTERFSGGGLPDLSTELAVR